MFKNPYIVPEKLCHQILGVEVLILSLVDLILNLVKMCISAVGALAPTLQPMPARQRQTILIHVVYNLVRPLIQIIYDVVETQLSQFRVHLATFHILHYLPKCVEPLLLKCCKTLLISLSEPLEFTGTHYKSVRQLLASVEMYHEMV